MQVGALDVGRGHRRQRVGRALEAGAAAEDARVACHDPLELLADRRTGCRPAPSRLPFRHRVGSPFRARSRLPVPRPAPRASRAPRCRPRTTRRWVRGTPCPARSPRPPVPRTRALRAASSTPAGWRRARPSTRPRHTPTDPAASSRRRGPCTRRRRGSAPPARPGASRGWGRVRPSRQAAQMVGNRAGKSPMPVASSQRWSRSRSISRRLMARATTSRGARSASGCSPRMKATPCSSRRMAPSPRSASDSSGRGIDGWCRAVGWNCMNSRSATATPARIAMAIPSPVDSDGIGGDGEALPRAPGGEHDVAGAHLARALRVHRR